MLRAEVYANAMRASRNRKKEVRREKEAPSFTDGPLNLVESSYEDYVP